ncbi:MAG: peptidylprolyl isomerase, partial [Pseudomonadales bacterium]|nr:peptidylprolyl isomerase [Pseudomonadales bacterium]
MPITTFRALAKFSAAALLPILLCHTTFAQTTEATTNTVKIPQKANTQVVLETNRGDITLELFDSKTPKTVKNFIGYVKSGFYNDTVFHRVIPGFAIQGGGFSKELAKKKTKKAIKNEATAELKNITGTI